MKTNELNDWLGVITNIGIIIGLALVGYEVHQNNIELERESRASEIGARVRLGRQEAAELLCQWTANEEYSTREIENSIE